MGWERPADTWAAVPAWRGASVEPWPTGASVEALATGARVDNGEGGARRGWLWLRPGRGTARARCTSDAPLPRLELRDAFKSIGLGNVRVFPLYRLYCDLRICVICASLHRSIDQKVVGERGWNNW